MSSMDVMLFFYRMFENFLSTWQVRWKESSTKLMRSNRTSYNAVLHSFSSWFVNASTQSDSNTMQTTIRSSIHMRCHLFYRTSWLRRWHLISSTRCVNTVISCSITTFLGKSIWSQISTRHLFKHTNMN